MKTLTQPEVTIDGDIVTIKGKVVDQPFNAMLTTRVSHTHANPDNMKHPRRMQSSNEAFFCESPYGKMAMPNSFFAAIAAVVEPATTFAPIFTKESTPNKVVVISETAVKLQWQVSDDAFPKAVKERTPPPASVWNDIAGANSDTLDESAIKVGQWIRCTATNASGTAITKAAQKK